MRAISLRTGAHVKHALPVHIKITPGQAYAQSAHNVLLESILLFFKPNQNAPVVRVQLSRTILGTFSTFRWTMRIHAVGSVRLAIIDRQGRVLFVRLATVRMVNFALSVHQLAELLILSAALVLNLFHWTLNTREG